MKDLQFTMLIAEVFTALVIAYFFIKSRLPKQTIEQQKQLIDALEGRIKDLETETAECIKHHYENEKKIKDLVQEVSTLRDVPLAEIAKSQEAIMETQKEILEILKEIKA